MTPTGSRDAARRHGAASLTVLGLGWLFVALSTAWVTLANPLVLRIVLRAAASVEVPVVPWIALGCLGTVPLAWGVAGFCRIVSATRVRPSTGGTTALRRIAGHLAQPATILTGVRLSSARVLPEVLVSAQGGILVRELDMQEYQVCGGHWEVSSGFGWIPCENPLEAAVRDAATVRRLLGTSELDFVVRVHTIVVSAWELDRIAGCGLVHPAALGSYLAALPAQRTMSDYRVQAVATLLGRYADLDTAAR